MKNPGTITDEQWEVIEGLYEMGAHTLGYVRADEKYRDDHNIELLGDSLEEMRDAFPGINRKD
jgi:hypothetical protein